ncbi:DUF2182 domain-containing protein [Nitratireductor pacificus]|uniref:DUF2182 domain-containing protein n=1 Tax=Nitratireductor pacificus pht-3B TaxID=391937 RepID=K2MZX6_9HYPH|nr:DUF2182 domain-containing protein [Nitratireductor pacificus]EKF17528.1 hypothetical protein NA2_17334 [Nitratireductor pacificus pht-3B]
MSVRDDDLPNLDAGARAAHGLALRARALSFTALGLAIVLAWAALVAMAVRLAAVDVRAAGPGGGLLAMLPDIPLPQFAETFLALCLAPADAVSGPARFWVLSAMWFLMAVAMMLPSAGPMIRTYCEIADTAAAKGARAVHPLVLVAGYATVWLGASFGFAGLIMLAAAMQPGGLVLSPLGGMAGAAVLAIAGAYQFSGLKEACLVKCRNPFATLFGRWSTRPAAVFRLGMEQGLWCLGCCWALMLVMLAVGTMNIFWMALLGVFVIVEKHGRNRVFTRLSGSLLLVWALALLVISL